MSITRRAFSRSLERRSADLAAFLRIPSNSSTSSWSTFGSIADRTALRQLTVNRCVGIISDTIAQLPIAAFRGAGAERHPMPDPAIIREPGGPGSTWPEWIGQDLVSMETRGNTYGWVTAIDGLGFPTQIVPLHPDEVVVNLDKATGKVLYHTPMQKEPTQRYPLGNLWHVKGMTAPGMMASLRGLSPIEYASATISTVLNAEEFASNLFADGTVPSGLLTTDATDVDEEDLKDILDRWELSHGGRSRRPAALANGLKFQPISMNAEESQFLETRRAGREEIAGYWGVPLHLLGMADKQSNWGTGVEENALQFITYTLGIRLVRFEAALSALLPPGQYVKFNVAGLLRGRLTERYQAYLTGRQGGWLNVDDIRALEEMPPLEGGIGQSYAQPLNWGSLGDGTPVPAAPSGSPGSADETGSNGSNIADITLALQKIYLAVGKVITVEEARDILNRGGAELPPLPAGGLGPVTEPPPSGP